MLFKITSKSQITVGLLFTVLSSIGGVLVAGSLYVDNQIENHKESCDTSHVASAETAAILFTTLQSQIATVDDGLISLEDTVQIWQQQSHDDMQRVYLLLLDIKNNGTGGGP